MSDLIYEALNTQIMTVWKSVSDIIQVLETKVLADDDPSDEAQNALVNLRELHDLMRNYEQLIKLRLEFISISKEVEEGQPAKTSKPLLDQSIMALAEVCLAAAKGEKVSKQDAARIASALRHEALSAGRWDLLGYIDAYLVALQPIVVFDHDCVQLTAFAHQVLTVELSSPHEDRDERGQAVIREFARMASIIGARQVKYETLQ